MPTPSLIDKYNSSGPRYTSYPTVPYWQSDRPAELLWEERLQDAFSRSNSGKGISLYIHLPYCESLCTYCGCNTRITRRHEVERPYIEALLQEWRMYLDLFDTPPCLSELHLGGGTPTFFSPENLQYLLGSILAGASLAHDAEFSFEGHPLNTRPEHLQALYDLGFRRVSFGIQDFDPSVQKAIHRIQSVESVERVTDCARRIGYHSINYDLIYGLPHQNLYSIAATMREVLRLRPDRIAFYSYAHVPWMRPGQRSYGEADLPQGEAKRALYEFGCELLGSAGYLEVGMDHFALPGDALFEAQQQARLNRNFMGYTTSQSELLIGLGASAISDCGSAYVQNEKNVEAYMAQVQQGDWPYYRGHLLTCEDKIMRRHIHELMCRYETSWKHPSRQCTALFESLGHLDDLLEDQFVHLHPYGLRVTPEGKAFIRNICMAFDARMRKEQDGEQRFSGTV